MSLKEFDKDAYNAFYTIENYCSEILKEVKGAKENPKQVGIIDEVWETYKERFNYDIRISFEDQAARIDSETI